MGDVCSGSSLAPPPLPVSAVGRALTETHSTWTWSLPPHSPHIPLYSPVHPQAPSGSQSGYSQLKLYMPAPRPPHTSHIPVCTAFSCFFSPQERKALTVLTKRRGAQEAWLYKDHSRPGLLCSCSPRRLPLGCGDRSRLGTRLQSAAGLILFSPWGEIP